MTQEKTQISILIKYISVNLLFGLSIDPQLNPQSGFIFYHRKLAYFEHLVKTRLLILPTAAILDPWHLYKFTSGSTNCLVDTTRRNVP